MLFIYYTVIINSVVVFAILVILICFECTISYNLVSLIIRENICLLFSSVQTPQSIGLVYYNTLLKRLHYDRHLSVFNTLLPRLPIHPSVDYFPGMHCLRPKALILFSKC